MKPKKKVIERSRLAVRIIFDVTVPTLRFKQYIETSVRTMLDSLVFNDTQKLEELEVEEMNSVIIRIPSEGITRYEPAKGVSKALVLRILRELKVKTSDKVGHVTRDSMECWIFDREVGDKGGGFKLLYVR